MTILEDSPVIAAVRGELDFERALKADVSLVFHLNASILTLEDALARAHAAGKRLFVHIDLAEGIGRDAAGLSLLARMGTDGIISTRSVLIRHASECGLLTVQRFFIVDSHSVSTSIEAIENTRPAMVELMPGVIPKIITRFADRTFSGSSIPVIAGGMIDSKAEIVAALGAGAAAVSTGRAELWNI